MSNVERHQPGTPSWVDYMAPDLEKARAFYGGLFGWRFSIGPAETGHYTMCQVGERNAAGMGQKPENAPYPPAWNVYFSVEDVDASCARIREHGGQVVMEPMDVM
ncbi:MAG TPA: VOC family protein, partial [Myxococcaceae bacterium]|nr:VOC family protein [Myxococcaceae bacterium]